MSELSIIKSKLNRRNKHTLDKLSNYIYANCVNTNHWKEIRINLAGRLLESQERGEDSETVIGKNYKAFPSLFQQFIFGGKHFLQQINMCMVLYIMARLEVLVVC